MNSRTLAFLVPFVAVAPALAQQRTLAEIRAQYDAQVMAVPGVVGVGTGANGLVVYLEHAAAQGRVRAALPGLFNELTASGHGVSFVVTGPIVAQQRTLAEIRAQYDAQVMAVPGVVGVGTGANGLVVLLKTAATEARVRAALPALFSELVTHGYGVSFDVTGPIVAQQRSLADVRAQYEPAILAVTGVVGLGEGASALVVYVEAPADVARVRAALPSGLTSDLDANGLTLRLEAIGRVVAYASLREIRDRHDAAVMRLRGVAGVGSSQTGLVIYVVSEAARAEVNAGLPGQLRAELLASGFDLNVVVSGPFVALSGDWQPLARGDRWTFREQRSGEEVRSWSGRKVGNWRRVGLADLGARWATLHRNRLYVWDGRPQRVFDFELATGDGVDVNLSGREPGRMVLAARDELVATPASTFRGCTRFDWIGATPGRGWGSFWFAPGVGLIKWTQWEQSNARTFELARAHVGGRDLPAGGPTLPAPLPSLPAPRPAR
ncbi:MAG: hypothetical protein KDD82_16620 [Planctomycetes bacterium]|nr:hypothetical protein [Planctomycetota bacterium]